jgi:hypothetical protein
LWSIANHCLEMGMEKSLVQPQLKLFLAITVSYPREVRSLKES